MHDIHPTTVDAVPAIVKGMKDKGVRMVTLSELSLNSGTYEAGHGYCLTTAEKQTGFACKADRRLTTTRKRRRRVSILRETGASTPPRPISAKVTVWQQDSQWDHDCPAQAVNSLTRFEQSPEIVGTGGA